MKISVLTLFPDMIRPYLAQSILARALAAGQIEVEIFDIRDYAANKHRQADDAPFGGGNGLVMMAQPVFDCMAAAQAASRASKPRRIFTSPHGALLTRDTAKRLAQEEELIILCGHYEGVDQRIRETLIDEEISIGDVVLTGGELACLAIIDSVARFLPGVLGNAGSAHEDSFEDGLLEYPQYTRPRSYQGMEVPEVLCNGNHREIDRWRRQQSLAITKRQRPDLLEAANLSAEDKAYLETI